MTSHLIEEPVIIGCTAVEHDSGRKKIGVQVQLYRSSQSILDTIHIGALIVAACTWRSQHLSFCLGKHFS